MPRIRVPLTSFDYGEVSPSLRSRTDANIYTHAAQKLRNFFIRSEGGLEKRSGTRIWYESPLSYSSSATGLQLRLEPFVFSDDEKYLVGFSNARIDIWRLLTDGTVSHIQTITADVSSAALPFNQAKVGELTFAQSGDVMFITHTTFMIRKLVRTGLTTFQVETFAFESSTDNNRIFQPYHSFQNVGVTLAASATTGSGVTFTASSAYFESGHVGTTLLVNETDVDITGFTSSTVVTGTINGTLRQQLTIDALETVEGSNRVLVTHIGHGLAPSASITIDRAAAVGGITAANINGSRTIASVIDENTYEITAGANATSSAVGAAHRALQAALLQPTGQNSPIQLCAAIRQQSPFMKDAFGLAERKPSQIICGHQRVAVSLILTQAMVKMVMQSMSRATWVRLIRYVILFQIVICKYLPVKRSFIFRLSQVRRLRQRLHRSGNKPRLAPRL